MPFASLTNVKIALTPKTVNGRREDPSPHDASLGVSTRRIEPLTQFTRLCAAAFLLLVSAGAADAFERPTYYKLRWADEFSKLDKKKWRCHEQVAISKGSLRLTASGTFSANRRSGGCRSADTGHLNSWKGQTRKGEAYQGPTFAPEGWLEFRMRTADVRGVMSEIVLWSNWLQIPDDSVDRWIAEIDIAEAKGHTPYEVWISTHAWRFPNWTTPKIDSLQNDTAPITRGRYATYVLHWSITGAPEDFLRVYVNGYLRHERDLLTAPSEVFGAPLSITMGAWIPNEGQWGAEEGVDWGRASKGAHMYVDWVRYYAP